MNRRVNSDGESLVTVEDQEQYAVQAIRSHKTVGGVNYYLVKWLDYPEAQNTWQPGDNLCTVKKMIADYMQRRNHFKKDRANRGSQDSLPQSRGKIQDDSVKAAEPKIRTPQKNKQLQKALETKINRPPEKTKKSNGFDNKPAKQMMKELTKIKKLNNTKEADKSEQRSQYKSLTKSLKQTQKKLPTKDKISSVTTLPIKSALTNLMPANLNTMPNLEDNIRAKSVDEREDGSHSSREYQERFEVKKAEFVSTGVQVPDKQDICRVNHIVIKNGEILYEVEYAKGTQNKQLVSLLPSSVVLQANSQLVVQYFERNLINETEDTSK